MKKRIVLVLCMVTLLITAMALAVACGTKDKAPADDNSGITNGGGNDENGDNSGGGNGDVDDSGEELELVDISQYLTYELNEDGNSYAVTGLTEEGYVLAGNTKNIDFLGKTVKSKLIIPTLYQGKTVTAIADSAFSGCWSITKISIPNNVTIIGKEAFLGCESLVNITLSSKVTKIADGAFLSCWSIKSITIPDGVTSIGDWAFSYCSSLTSITIPGSVTSIGDEAFYNCFSLIEVYNKSSLSIVAGSSDYGYVGFYAKNVYTEEGGSKLSTDKNGYVIYVDGDDIILVKYMGNDTDLTLPIDITEINQGALYLCHYLTSITIPVGVTSIGDCAFSGCYSLIEVYNKSSLDIVAGSSDYGEVARNAKNVYTEECRSKLNIDENGYIIYTDGEDNILVKYLGKDTDLTLPNGITGINQGAFLGRTNLTSISISERVTRIGLLAFSGCGSLTNINIPKSVTSIESSAFNVCSGLIRIEFQGTQAEWEMISKDSYWDNNTGQYTIYCTDGDIAKE